MIKIKVILPTQIQPMKSRVEILKHCNSLSKTKTFTKTKQQVVLISQDIYFLYSLSSSKGFEISRKSDDKTDKNTKFID